MHFYDEQRLLLGKTYQAGDKVRLTAPAGTRRVDGHRPARLRAGRRRRTSSRTRRERPAVRRRPDRRADSAPAIDTAIAVAKSRRLTVYIPPGTYQVNRHIVVDDVTIEGAGSWYTIIKGRQVALDAPLPDGSMHTGVGFYGKYAETAAAPTCTCRTSRSRATCASASTPTRSTASAAR